MLDGLVKELLGTDHHFQFFECFFHLAAIKILSKRVLTGNPKHSDRRLVGFQNSLGGLVDIQ